MWGVSLDKDWKNKSPDQYYQYSIASLRVLMSQIYTPDLCEV